MPISTTTPTVTPTNRNTWSVVAGSIVGNACTNATNRTQDASALSNSNINRRNSSIVDEFGGNSASQSGRDFGGGAVSAPRGNSLVGGLVGNLVSNGINIALNGGNLQDVITGTLNEAVGGLLNNVLSQLPPEIAGVFQQAFGDLAAGLGLSLGGAGGAAPFVPPTSPDTYLQGVQGSLSSVGGGLATQLPAAIGQGALGAGFAGALGGLTQNLGAVAQNLGNTLGNSLGNALGGMAEGLGQAAGQLASGLGDAIGNIPGIGPAIQNFTSAVGNFTSNVGGAFNALPGPGQAIVGAAIGAVGSNLLCKKTKKPVVSSEDQQTVRDNLKFSDNPIGNADSIASAASQLDKLIYGQTKNDTFAKLAASATNTSNQLKRCIRFEDGSYVFVEAVERLTAQPTSVLIVEEGKITQA